MVGVWILVSIIMFIVLLAVIIAIFDIRTATERMADKLDELVKLMTEDWKK